MLRYDHAAAPIGFDPFTVSRDTPREVLIAGGTLRPPAYDATRPGQLFEPPLPGHPEDAARFLQKPTFLESAAAVVFEFRPDDPARSTFRVVDSPSGDPRVHFALAPLAVPGPLILGGENPLQPGEVYLTAEVYLIAERRLAPLAVPLAAPRSRAGAFVVPGVEGVAVYLLGGSSSPEGTEGFADVERLRIPAR
jgi:hypothetical protein